MSKGKLDSKKKIEIFDDTGSGDSFDVSEILYENDEVILCKVHNDWYDPDMTVLIYKKDKTVISQELRFYLAHNI